jgi:hypothetical protein
MVLTWARDNLNNPPDLVLNLTSTLASRNVVEITINNHADSSNLLKIAARNGVTYAAARAFHSKCPQETQ